MATKTVPLPAAIPGWYVANEKGHRPGYTADPNQAKLVPVCSLCDEYHPGPEGACLL